MAKIASFDVTLIGARTADGDVDICAQIAVLHVAITGAQIPQDLAPIIWKHCAQMIRLSM